MSTAGWVRALDVQGSAHEVHLYAPYVRDDGTLVPERDRQGSEWPAGTMSVIGRNGGWITSLSLTAGQMRQMSDYLLRLAAFLDARAKGEPGKCLCTAWVMSSDACPNDALPDYSMCATCWPTEPDERGRTGQSALDMSHRHRPRPQEDQPTLLEDHRSGYHVAFEPGCEGCDMVRESVS